MRGVPFSILRKKLWSFRLWTGNHYHILNLWRHHVCTVYYTLWKKWPPSLVPIWMLQPLSTLRSSQSWLAWRFFCQVPEAVCPIWPFPTAWIDMASKWDARFLTDDAALEHVVANRHLFRQCPRHLDALWAGSTLLSGSWLRDFVQQHGCLRHRNGFLLGLVLLRQLPNT